MAKIKLILAVGAVASLSACLSSDVERGIVGAGAGAVIATSTGVDPVTGAIVGGAAGALCDEFTRICR